MFFNLIQASIAWLEANFFIVGLVMSITAYFKLLLTPYKWALPWMVTAFAFLMAYLFAVPSWPFAFTIEYVLNGFMLGLAATGIYKTGAALAEKAQDL
jgi:hypothetical protein